jgi:hypothetical protein
MELGDHEEANEELELIDAPLRAHPDVLEVRWLIHQKAENWELCENIASALVKLAPERTTGWIHRSFALHEMKRTQEAYDELKPALETVQEGAARLGTTWRVTRVCRATRTRRGSYWTKQLSWAVTRLRRRRWRTLTCRVCGAVKVRSEAATIFWTRIKIAKALPHSGHGFNKRVPQCHH